MQQPIFDKAVVPGQDSLSVAETAERLETALTEQRQLLADAGGIPLQHELVICTRSEATEISISYAISDPSGHLQTETPAWLDPNPHGSYADPTRDSFATAWDLPPESAPNRPTDLEALQNQGRLKQNARNTLLVRMEPVNQDPIDGATQRTPSQEILPDTFHWDTDPDLPPMPIVRWLRDSDTNVLLRIHLDVFRIDDALVSAEYCYHTDTTLPADETAIETVGYRPTIEAALQAPENEEFAAATQLGDHLSALLDTGDFVPTIYRAVQPAREQITSTDVLQDNSPVQYSKTHHEIITDGLARIKAGRGRPVRDNDGGSIQFSPVSPSDLASLYRVPAAPTLAREGIDIPGVDSTLTTLPREAIRHILADNGLTIGTDPGVVDDPLRLSQSATPPTQTIVSDDPEMYTELLAQQTIQRDDPAGTTFVADPTGNLAAALQQSCSEQYANVNRDVVVWDVATHPPTLAPFDITGLVDAGWDRADAIEFVTEIHDYLLQAVTSDYRVTTTPDTIAGGTPQPDCREQFQAALRNAAPQTDYSTIVTQLNDDWTRRVLSHYMSPRLDTDVSPATAKTAYHHASDLHNALDVFRSDPESDPDPVAADFLTACPNAILCLDVSGFDSTTDQRLATILLLRTLAYSIACTDSTELPPVTLTLAGVSLFSTTDFLTPLIDHARDPSSTSLNVLFGTLCDDDTASIPQPALTYESPLYLVATTSTVATQENAEYIQNRFPDTLPNSVSCLKKQAGDASQAAVALASECLPTGTAPITCTVRRPHAHSVQHGEPDAASTTDSQNQPSPDVVGNLPGVVHPTSNSAETAKKTMHAEPSESETTNESKGSQQVVLPTETAPTTEPSAEDHSASSPSEGVYKTYEGPTCETCWTVYDRVAEAAACHPSATLTKTRSRGESVTSRTPPDLAYSQRLIDRLDTNTTTHIADMIRIVAGQPSREDALTRIRDAVFDEPERADPWSVTFLIAIELARLGCLPGYTLHESMTTIRDDCLSRSAYTADSFRVSYPT
jgi:hypothetical protein